MEFKLLDKNDFVKVLPQLTKLFQACFNQKVHNEYTEEAFIWRHIKNPFDDLLYCVALDNGKVVGSHAGMPCLMFINHKEVSAVIALQTATHPDYQGQGIFSRLVKMLNSFVSEKGYKVIYNFPNHISHRTYVTRLDRKDIYEIPTMQLELKNLNNISNVHLETDIGFEFNYDNFTATAELNSVQKSQAYLRWRYKDNPINTYFNFVLHNNRRISSFMVVKEYQNRLNIIDFQAKDPEEGEYLLSGAFNFAKSLNLDLVTTWAPRHTFFHTMCEKYGFRNNVPITYFVMTNLTGGQMDISTNYSDWYIQLGDYNVY